MQVLRLRVGMAALAIIQSLFWASRLLLDPGTPVVGVSARAAIVGSGLVFFLVSFLPLMRRHWSQIAMVGGCVEMVAHVRLATLEGMTIEYALPPIVLFFAVCAIAATRAEIAVFVGTALLAPPALLFLHGAPRFPFLPLLLMVAAAAGGTMVSWFRRRSEAALVGEIERRTSVEANLRVAHAHLERTNAELERASHAKDAFLANLSHELRTPLSVIIGYIELVLDGGLSSEQARQFLTRGTASARHLLRLISDMLDLTRLEAGRAQLEVESVDAAEVAREVCALTDVLARSKGLSLNLSVEPDVRVLANRQRLQQVLLNLVGNALKFTDQGSVTVRVEPENGVVCFRVRDTGRGIAPERQQLLFEKFVQLDDRSSGDAVEGVGLGLSICRELVTLMGGSIELSSSGHGCGTEVRFALPRDESAPGSGARRACG